MKKTIRFALTAIALTIVLTGCEFLMNLPMFGNEESSSDPNVKTALVTVLNDNVPYFTEEDYTYAKKNGPFTELSPLDSRGRVGVCWGLFDYEHMPTYVREPLHTEPTGWQQKKYDTSIVPGEWLYARAHLLAFQLSGYQDNPLNLMTGTREFNNEGMLPFENMAADHLREERDHSILYRVTPDFGDGNLLAYGVTMESDCLDCDEAEYCVYIANIQPGISIDYATGNNWLSSETPPEDDVTIDEATYILNTNSKKFHLKDCSGAPDETSANYKLTDKTREELLAEGYSACGICNP